MDNYVGEIRQFGGNFAPNGWAFCNGQILPIAENETLFALIGTTYGGDGQTTFALPNLQSRIPISMGTGGGGTYVIGQTAGTEQVTLIGTQLPTHTHLIPPTTVNGTVGVGTSASTNSPEGFATADDSGSNMYAAGPPNTAMGPDSVASTSPTLSVMPTGGNQPHDNMQPYLAVSYIISLYGIFPSQG